MSYMCHVRVSHMDTKTAIRYAKTFREVDVYQVVHQLRKLLPHLQDISTGKIPLETHTRWCTGTCKTRNGLNLRSNLVSCVTASTTHVIREELASFFCSENMKMFSYTMAVIFPEAVKLMVMKKYELSSEEAESIVFANIHVPDSSDSDDSNDSSVTKGEVKGDASDLLERSKKLQLEQKKRLCSASDPKPSSAYTPVCVTFMKKNKVGSFTRDTETVSVEAIMAREAEYADVLHKCSVALDMPLSCGERSMTLLSSGGCVIPSTTGWTLGGYMRQLHRGPKSVRLGVGYIIKKKTVLSLPSTSDNALGLSSGYSSKSVGQKTLIEVPDSDSTSDSLPHSSLKNTVASEKVVKSKDTSSDGSDFMTDPIPKKKCKLSKAPKKKVVAPKSTGRSSRQPRLKPTSGHCMEFYAKELSEATRTYGRGNVIGKGGFGTVYRGTLRYSTVAIKILSQDGKQAFLRAKPSTQFQTEVSILSRFRHPNIVQLLGFCVMPTALIFEFMENGSLYSKLHENCVPSLTWMQRRVILKDACRGLVFLHTATPPCVHQDIKSANILIDESYHGKLGDFGFSIEVPKLSSGRTVFTAACIARTEGYYPSEITAGKYSDRSDVYSFGVVVLETFTGLLAFDPQRDDSKLVDHYQEELLSAEKLSVCYDVLLDVPSQEDVTMYFGIITTTLRRHSARPPSTEVLGMFI